MWTEGTKKLILHIGRGKTGTSSLQHYLAQQRSQLIKAGICYPKSGTDGHPAHREIARLCQHSTVDFTGRLLQLRMEFEDEVEPYEKLIVSSERFQRIALAGKLSRFFRRPLPHLSNFMDVRAFLNKAPSWSSPYNAYHIHTVCYLREFLDYARSSYSQKVQKSDFSCTLAEYCQQTFRRTPSRFVGFWTAFSDQATFLLFDRSRFHGRNIVEDFFYHINATPPAPPEKYDQNPSISGNLLAFKLLVNRCGLHQPKMYAPLRELARNNKSFRGPFYISKPEALQLRREHSHYNAYLQSIVGDIPLSSFVDGHPVPDPPAWSRDLDQILSSPGLSHLRCYKAIVGAKPDDIEKIFRA